MSSTNDPTSTTGDKPDADHDGHPNTAGRIHSAPESRVSHVVQSRGITRMEAIVRVTKSNPRVLWLVAGSVLLCAWAYSLDFATTRYYSVDASSYYKQHSTIISTLAIVTNIVSAVSKPFIAKLSDITSRPYVYLLTLGFYIVGYVIVATSQQVSAYFVGEVLVAVGSSGIDLVNDIIVADLTPLEWRGFLGAILSTPFIINVWFSGKIVQTLSSKDQWRWGYGMFAIIMPVALGPSIATLFYLDSRAQKSGISKMTSRNATSQVTVEEDSLEAKTENEPKEEATISTVDKPPKETWTQGFVRIWHEMDAFGLILLGFGWSLLLLPFSLKTYAKHGWKNPSLIAMIIVGGVLLIAYVVYEINWAKFPSAPRRLVMNRTFIICVIIETFYFISSSLYGVFWPSYVYVAKPWSQQNWVYYGNAATLALCVFSPIAGLIQRWTHRYKTLQIFGLCVKIIGVGILLDGHHATISTGALVASSILIGGGGSFSAVGSRVASQACVPHQDVALVISLLSLWTAVGRAIGGAIVAVIWSSQMPHQLRTYLPRIATDADVKRLFNNIRAIRTKLPFGSPMREGAVEAYRHTLYYCLTPALCLAFVPLIAALFQSNFYLGKQQNAVTNVGTDGLRLSEEDKNQPLPPAKTKKERFLRFWSGN